MLIHSDHAPPSPSPSLSLAMLSLSPSRSLVHRLPPPAPRRCPIRPRRLFGRLC